MKANLTIAIASGKGGTGKTTIATNLAYALQHLVPTQLIDCDVDEPNAHLFLNPTFRRKASVGIPTPVIDAEKCILCGQCKNFCVYNAITLVGNSVLVFPEMCHGCGGCSYLCPVHAITTEEQVIGTLEEGSAQDIEFIHGKLQVGTVLTPPLIRALTKKVAPDKVTILDAPPGTSCPVVTTIEGVDYVLLVTEPTPFGLHDLDLAVQVVRKLDISFGVVINRSDLGNSQIEEYCENQQIPVLLKVGFKERYATWYARGEIIAARDLAFKQALQDMYQQIVRRLAQ